MAEKIEDLTINEITPEEDPNIALIPSIYSEIQKIEGTDLGEIKNKDANETYDASTDSLEAISDKITTIDSNIDLINGSLNSLLIKVYESDITQSTTWRNIYSLTGAGFIKFLSYNNTANQISGAVATGYAGFRVYLDNVLVYSNTTSWGTSNGGISGILKYNTGEDTDLFTISTSTSDFLLGYELNLPFSSSVLIQSYVYKSNGPLSEAILTVSNKLNMILSEN